MADLDLTAECAASDKSAIEAIEEEIATNVARQLSANKDDVSAEACIASGRRLEAVHNQACRLSEQTIKVVITESPATDLNIVDQTLKTSKETGALADVMETSLTNKGKTGVTMTEVGSTAESTQKGVRGTAPAV